uniref:Cytosolic fatty-acid binding proteins domain-containing protein n=1 Tax=Pyxicephalus adspersus TaxID=30357 RepID=A0AAV3AN15_PYXAD|nr:TPA: hypothetical protein GDO54_006501 [Pyxicephalus adspersus]
MNFTGTYELKSQENYELFMGELGFPEIKIQTEEDIMILTKIVQNGNDFIWSQVYPDRTITNNFTTGEESEMQTVIGTKVKATVDMIDKKLIRDFKIYQESAEIVESDLVEVSIYFIGSLKCKQNHSLFFGYIQ